MPSDKIRTDMAIYGMVQTITGEECSNAYRYSVWNGIRIVNIDLKTYVPSNIYTLEDTGH
jgi:hypothetical protein